MEENEGQATPSSSSANGLQFGWRAGEAISHRVDGTQTIRAIRNVGQDYWCHYLDPLLLTHAAKQQRHENLSKLAGWPWRTHQNIWNSFRFYHLPSSKVLQAVQGAVEIMWTGTLVDCSQVINTEGCRVCLSASCREGDLHRHSYKDLC